MQNKLYYVFDKNGLFKTFTNYYNFLYFIFINSSSVFGNSLKDKRWYYPPRYNPLVCPLYTPLEFKQVIYIAYDSNMCVIPCKVLDKLCSTFSPTSFRHHIKNRKKVLSAKDETFRKTPISGLIKKNWRYYSYLRSPKTLQELKHNLAYKEFTRGKRRNIPTNFDDLVRSDRLIEHSWKKQKKRKQWM